MQTHELPLCPFVGPKPFRAADRRFFVGRNRDSARVRQELLSSRLTILHGRSGVGKSSLLKAAVAPEIDPPTDMNEPEDTDVERQGVCVYWELWKSPEALAQIRHKLAERLRRHGCDVSEGMPLDEQIYTATHESPPISVFLLLDQFEDYLNNSDEDFDAEIARSVNRRNLRAGILIGIRDDCLAALDHLDWRIPGLRANQTGLAPLDDNEVARTIREPLRRIGVGFDDALPETLIREIRASDRREVESSPAELAYVQLVMQEFYESEREIAKPGAFALTAAAFDTRLGGVHGIVSRYFRRHVDELPDNGGNICRRIFHHLTTPSGHRVALSFNALADYADSSPQQLEAVLTRLREDRVIRPIGEHQYEIPHDSMARVIRAWVDGETMREEAEKQKEDALQGALARLSEGLQNRVAAAERRAQDAEARARISEIRRVCAQATTLAMQDPQLALLLALRAGDAAWSESVALQDGTARGSSIDSVWRDEVNRTIEEAENGLRVAVERALLDPAATGIDDEMLRRILDSIRGKRGDFASSEFTQYARLPEVVAAVIISWELPDLFALAKACATRDLTPAEASRYLGAASGAALPALPMELGPSHRITDTLSTEAQTISEDDLSFAIPEESDDAETSTE